MSAIYLYGIGIWLIMAVLAIINGILRERIYGPMLNNEILSHQISSFIAIFLFLAVIYLFLRFTSGTYSGTELVILGVMWLAMTVVFEFGFGHYIAGHSWERLLADYNILKGRLWSFVLLSALMGPYLIGKYLLRTV